MSQDWKCGAAGQARIRGGQLPRDEALAFQTELKNRNYPTEVVLDRELPVLHQSFQVQRVLRREEVLILTDSMSREKARPITDLVFLAGGFLKHLKFKPEWRQRIDYGLEYEGFPKPVTEREIREETELEFRLDLFFHSTPNRQHLLLAKDTAVFHQGNPVRLRDTTAVMKFAAVMAALLPAERLIAMSRRAGEGDHVADVGHAGDEHQHALEPRPKPACGHAAVFPQIGIPAVGLGIEAVVLHVSSSTSSRSSRWLPPMISPMPGTSTSMAVTVCPSSLRRM
jgi:hypothetical protein